MIDQETQLDNTIALPDNSFQYNLTLINMEKADVDIKALEENIKPGILNSVRTNPDMKMMRDQDVTLMYDYKDKNKDYLFKLTITPDQYKGAN